MSVVLFHSVNSHPLVTTSALGRVLMNGWAGVFLFFPVSGYCISAAMHRAENASPVRFLKRRWKRIYPPYLASILLAVGLGLAALPFNRGSVGDLTLNAPAWLSILTLTQVFTPYYGRINPVYWSLCYEEQFYLVMALALLIRRDRGRAALLTLVTAAAVATNIVQARVSITGPFLDYWMSFAFGIAVYLWLHEREDRWWSAAIFALGVVDLLTVRDLSIAISFAGAMLMLVLARMDDRIAGSRVSRPLFALGLISYSLYLVHVPIAGRLTNTLVRFGGSVGMCAIGGAVVATAAAALFFALVERRFLARPAASAALLGSAGRPPATT